jgi:hypothetical protein
LVIVKAFMESSNGRKRRSLVIVKAFMESSRAVYRAAMDVRGGVWSLLRHSWRAAGPYIEQQWT